MSTNRHIIARLTKAFDQAARANGGYYKAQPTRCDRCHAPLTPDEQAEAATQPDSYRNCAVCQEGL